MDRIIQSPGKYIQGAGAIKRLGDYLKPLAERWLVVGDKFVLGFAEEMLRKSLADAGLAAEIAPFGGECSHNEINRLRDIAGNAKCTAVLGIGGGKTLDTAKALAHFMNVPVAIAPTIASTDAPCSALSVIYTDEGEFDSYLMLPRNPNMVIVDTQIVAGAPAACWPPGLAMRWLPGSKPAPAPVAAPPPWRAGSAPRRRWRWPSYATTPYSKRVKKRCWPPNSTWSPRRWSGWWKPTPI